MKLRLPLVLAVTALLLAACDIPGVSPDPRIAMREADSKAIGNACRYAVRGLEECYATNPKAFKPAILEGWREMDAYMRDNNIQGQPAARTAQAEAGHVAAAEQAEGNGKTNPQSEAGGVKKTEDTKAKSGSKKPGIRL
jgi:hypothetical protein